MNKPIDWHSAPLSEETRIDKNYKTTQNVRRFFQAQLCRPFKFDATFMAWLKSSQGKTLKEAIEEFKSRTAPQ